MIILTHEGSDTASFDMEDIQEHFYPLRPMLLKARPAITQQQLLYGRATIREAVWYGWREHKDSPSNPICNLGQSVELVATLVQEIVFCILVDSVTQRPESRFFV